jgi:hypothetical protein
MSLELKDFRLGITAEIDAALTAVSRAFGRDKQEVAREVLGEWAARKHVEARVLTGLSQANGTATASDGTAPEDGGTRRQRGRR